MNGHVLPLSDLSLIQTLSELPSEALSVGLVQRNGRPLVPASNAAATDLNLIFFLRETAYPLFGEADDLLRGVARALHGASPGQVRLVGKLSQGLVKLPVASSPRLTA